MASQELLGAIKPLVGHNYIITESLLHHPWAQNYFAALARHSLWVAEHSVRVDEIGIQLMVVAGFPLVTIINSSRAFILHDIGKIRIPGDILDDLDLDMEEEGHIAAHVRVGFDMIKPHDIKAAMIMVAHHESQTDWSRYPRTRPRENNDDLLFREQQILALADIADALLSDRPYVGAMPEEKAREILLQSFPEDWVDEAIRARLNLNNFRKTETLW